jgi:hypothetical protein
MIAAVAGLAGLSAMLLMPVASQAGGWRHHWHRTDHWVRHRNCRRIAFTRYCRVRHGERQCYVNRRVRNICRD